MYASIHQNFNPLDQNVLLVLTLFSNNQNKALQKHYQHHNLSLSMRGGRTKWWYSVFAFYCGISVIGIQNGRYLVFQSPNDDGKIQFLIENTTVKVFMQKFDYSITVSYKEIESNTVI